MPVSFRLCLVLDLVDDAALIAAYEQHHAPGAVWPVIVDDIRAQGILDMEIWRSGDRLVMVASLADDYPRPRAVPPEHDAWEALMWRFQKAVPHAAPGQKWVPMTRIFALAEQKGSQQTP